MPTVRNLFCSHGAVHRRRSHGAGCFDAAARPLGRRQMDMIHADGAVWEAVFETTGDTFRLNYVEKREKDPRPTGFKTSEKTEESLDVLQRQKQ